KGGKDFANGKRRYNCDCHRELHRHAALSDVFVRLVKYRKAADKSARHTEGGDVGIRSVAKKPVGPRCRSHEHYAVDLPQIQRMSVVLNSLVVMEWHAIPLKPR